MMPGATLGIINMYSLAVYKMYIKLDDLDSNRGKNKNLFSWTV